MKKSLMILILIFCQTFVFGQTKFDEYEGTDSDSESLRVGDFLYKLNEQPNIKGLIVIYAGENRELLGNILKLIEGMKNYNDYITKNKPLIIIAEGKKPLYKEFWLIPEGSKNPEFNSVDYDFSNLKTKYLYAFSCLDCEPAVPQLSSNYVDLKFYADILKKNVNFQALIDIYLDNFLWSKKEQLKDARKYAADYRKKLTKDFGIENRRVTIRIKKSVEKESPTLANLYIMPSK